MKNFEYNKEIFKNKITPITLSVMMGLSMIGFSGCAKNETSDVKYTVKKTEELKDYEKNNNVINDFVLIGDFTYPKTDNKKYAEYDYYVDLTKLSEYNFTDRYVEGEIENEDLAYENKGKDYVYKVRHINQTTSGVDGAKLDNAWASPKYFTRYSSIILPDNLTWAASYINNPVLYCNKTITGDLIGKINFTELYSINGNRYLYQETKLEVKNDIKMPSSNIIYNKNVVEQQSLNKGDYILNKSLYKINNNMHAVLIANKQEGVGSNCMNVQDSIVADLDVVYKSISSLKNRKSIDFDSSEELDQYIYNGVEPKKRH